MLLVDRAGQRPLYHEADTVYPSSDTITQNTLRGENHTIALKVDRIKNLYFVEINGKTCENAQSVIRIAPLLRNEPQLLAKTINFLAQGNRYKLIEDPVSYRESYNEMYQGQSKLGITGGIVGYGRFQTEEITLPTIVDNTLTFYVNQTWTHVPNRVTCPLDGKGSIKYSVLRSSM